MRKARRARYEASAVRHRLLTLTYTQPLIPGVAMAALWVRRCGTDTVRPSTPTTVWSVHLSGTKVRDLLKSGQRPPMEFSRPEVADILIRWAQSVV